MESAAGALTITAIDDDGARSLYNKVRARHLVHAVCVSGVPVRRTLKLLSALANGWWVVNGDYLEACAKSRSAIDPAPYELSARQCPGCRMARQNGPGSILRGLEITLRGNKTSIPIDDLTALLKDAGATVRNGRDVGLPLQVHRLRDRALLVDVDEGALLDAIMAGCGHWNQHDDDVQVDDEEATSAAPSPAAVDDQVVERASVAARRMTSRSAAPPARLGIGNGWLGVHQESLRQEDEEHKHQPAAAESVPEPVRTRRLCLGAEAEGAAEAKAAHLSRSSRSRGQPPPAAPPAPPVAPPAGQHRKSISYDRDGQKGPPKQLTSPPLEQGAESPKRKRPRRTETEASVSSSSSNGHAEKLEPPPGHARSGVAHELLPLATAVHEFSFSEALSIKLYRNRLPNCNCDLRVACSPVHPGMTPRRREGGGDFLQLLVHGLSTRTAVARRDGVTDSLLAACTFIPHPEHAMCELQLLAVGRAHSGKGVGSTLLAHVEHWLKAQGISIVVALAGLDTVEFWRKRAYVEVHGPSGAAAGQGGRASKRRGKSSAQEAAVTLTPQQFALVRDPFGCSQAMVKML